MNQSEGEIISCKYGTLTEEGFMKEGFRDYILVSTTDKKIMTARLKDVYDPKNTYNPKQEKFSLKRSLQLNPKLVR